MKMARNLRTCIKYSDSLPDSKVKLRPIETSVASPNCSPIIGYSCDKPYTTSANQPRPADLTSCYDSSAP